MDSDRVHAQCLYETQVAARLQTARNRETRMPLYGEIAIEYERLFPEHLPTDSVDKDRTADYEKAFVARFLAPNMTVAEIGPGRCHLAYRLAGLAKRVYGVDVSSAYLGKSPPENFEFRLTDGIHMPFPDNSVDLVVSNQLMEHLHPDDAFDQLREIYRVIAPGGGYCCVTPSRVNGPHDSSAYFDDIPCPTDGRNYVANGLHLKEYTINEMIAIFRRTGFRHIRPYIGARGRYVPIADWLLASVERTVQIIPADRRKRSSLLGIMLGNRIIASK